MKSIFESSSARTLFASALSMFSAIFATSQTNAAAVVGKPDGSAPVTVADDGTNWILDNGIIKARINKNSGIMRSMVYRNLETMGPGGIWEETPELAPKKFQVVTIDPASNGGARTEV